jgi:glycosyltransferase involved in cell wall biosynthesis
MISDQHLVIHGGIGQFAKGFCEMAELNDCVVDLILDTKPRDVFFKHSGLTIWPKTPLGLADHRNIFAFNDSYCLERAINFRDSLMLAFQKNLYDMILINTPEAFLGTYCLDFARYIPVVFYTHNENLVFRDEKFKGVFNPTFDAFFIEAMRSKDLIIGTQTIRNVNELTETGCNSCCLPMPMPERGLLEPYEGKKEGLLFIGRWEERKDPKEFFRVAEKLQLPVKVMTAARSVKKFQDRLNILGLKHDVRGGITGQEKVDFIRSSKVFYNPSKSESYGFSFLEAAGHCHVVVLDDYNWTDNFDSRLCHKVKKADVVNLIKRLYTQDLSEDNLALISKIDQDTWTNWGLLLNGFVGKKSNSSAADVYYWDNFLIEDFIKSLGRFASSEDIISILANRHKFEVTYDKTDTWLSTTGQVMPKKEDLFDFHTRKLTLI